jgi:hypothetical protein
MAILHMIKMCIIISYDSIFFSDKMDHNKICNNFYFLIRQINVIQEVMY